MQQAGQQDDAQVPPAIAGSSNNSPAAAAGPQYDYRTLADLVLCFVPGFCNFYAIITDCSVPRPTRKDWMSNMKVADPSILQHPGFPDGVDILFFATRPEDLPQPGCKDQLIRLHRCVLQEYMGKAQFVARIGRGRPTQYCLFSQDDNEEEQEVTAYYSSAPHYTMNERESNIVRLLRNALRDLPEQHAVGTYIRRIQELDPPNMTSLNHQGESEPNTFFDICCKVLYVEGERNAKTMYVWDGSDARPFLYRADRREAFVGENGLDEAQRAALLLLTPRELPNKALEGAPRKGTALPVVQHGTESLPREIPLPEAGSWVKLRNLAATLVDGQLQGLMLKSSKWAPWQLPDDFLQSLEQREASGRVAEPPPADDDLWARQQTDLPFQTLREIQQNAASGEQHLHRCLVRVVGYSVPEGGGVTSTAAQCNLRDVPGSPAPEQHLWAFQLHLQDATASVAANVFGPEGDTFFTVEKEGQQVQELTPDVAAENQELMTKVMEALRGTLGPRQQPGRWMDCCLRSYSLNRHNDPVGSRVYMVTKTQMTKTVEEATSADAN